MEKYRLFSLGVLFLLSIVSVPRVWAQTALENPQPASFQSGIGVIFGWACDAGQIEIAFNGGPRQTTAYGTSRGDTQSPCGDTDNGFGLLYNWNLLGDGVHTVQAYADGVEFANVTVIVATLGEVFLRGASGAFPVSDFPTPGATRTLRWQEAQQNFVISAGSSQGAGWSGRAPQVLENPQPGSFQSGIGVISGWACDAWQIEISFDGGPLVKAGTGTQRGDTGSVCGDTDNGFGLTFNWNLLGDGSHTVQAYAAGVEFASVTVTVTTQGEAFRRGLRRLVTLPDFPEVGTDVILQWQEAQQNFVISTTKPTTRLVSVQPQIRLPSGLPIPNLTVSSLFSDSAEVRASSAPTLLLAEDADGIVLLALADQEGGLLGEAPGEVEVSVESTAVTLVGLAAGIAVADMTPAIVATIQADASYPGLLTAIGQALQDDKNFLANGGGATVETVQIGVEDMAARLRADHGALAGLRRGSTPHATHRPAADLVAVLCAAGRTLAPGVAHAAAPPARDCEEQLNDAQQQLIIDEATQLVPGAKAVKNGLAAASVLHDILENEGVNTECYDREEKAYQESSERTFTTPAGAPDWLHLQDEISRTEALKKCAIGAGSAFGAAILELTVAVVKDLLITKGMNKLKSLFAGGKAWFIDVMEKGYAAVKQGAEAQRLAEAAARVGCAEIDAADIVPASNGTGGGGGVVSSTYEECMSELRQQHPSITGVEACEGRDAEDDVFHGIEPPREANQQCCYNDATGPNERGYQVHFAGCMSADGWPAILKTNPGVEQACRQVTETEEQPGEEETDHLAQCLQQCIDLYSPDYTEYQNDPGAATGCTNS